MATFTNRATLSYNGQEVSSNIVTGEIAEVLSGSKTATTGSYSEGSTVTYVISLVNSGAAALNNLTVTDNLGEYQFENQSLYPLSYIDGSLLYYADGVLQASPQVTVGPPLVISGVNVPANGDAVIVYRANVTQFAPLTSEAEITNLATVSGDALTNPLTLTETISVEESLRLDITKALSPSVVEENGEIVYTFTVRNYGTVPAVAEDNVTLTDTFDPILGITSVAFNGEAWASPINYTYNTATGVFTTVPGQIVVPAATVIQNADGTFAVNPGIATLVVTGNI